MFLVLVIDFSTGKMFETLEPYFIFLSVFFFILALNYCFVTRIVISEETIEFKYFPSFGRNVIVKISDIKYFKASQAYLFTNIKITLKNEKVHKLSSMVISEKEINKSFSLFG